MENVYLKIAQEAKMEKIVDIASKLGLKEEDLELYGNYKAKIDLSVMEKFKDNENGKVILVTAINPTPAGEGKSTTTVGLGQAFTKIGEDAIIALREPSFGPVMGVKGGAAGGGYSQVVPMEDINLHFTGDFHAIGVAHALLAAMVDNHINHGNALGIDPRRIQWKRVVDMNDRALRKITIGQGGPANGYLREDGFDIVVASEIMAILCLATSRADLKERLGKILIGYKRDNKTPIFARELNAHGAMAALLKDAINPNLVQTLENNVAIIHGGPFANIAHGCNTVTATKTGLKLADYVITEGGFGADLGAEKFINIKTRMADLNPAAIVLVATIRAMKYHGGVAKDELNNENLEALDKGMVNMERHIKNIQEVYGLPCIVCLNHFTLDTDAEVDMLIKRCESLGVKAVVSKHWAEGGAGAEELAKEVADVVDNNPGTHQLTYEDSDSLWEKIEKIATKVYGAASISADAKVKKQLADWNDEYGSYPVCMAKTQMSFSTDPTAIGAPTGHNVHITEVRLANGAGFIVAIAGNMMTMPGLPKVPAAERIDIDDDGNITGLF
jgi:formate--tetrahydrofolate ligase